MAKRNESDYIGSVSHGTLRAEDLIPAFASLLWERDKELAREVRREFWTAPPQCTAEELGDMRLEALFEALDACAPDYCYFGAHEGDGSDFGYWPCWDALDELNHIGDPAELDSMGGNEAVYVNDHGNVTLYARGEDGQWRIVWDIV